MWNILGTVIRPYGLTATEEGLHIRIPDMEDLDKKKARVFLTKSPTEARKFLIKGNQDDWTECFASIDALFAYAARCKLYPVWLAHENARLQEQQATNTKATLKSNDRKRMRSRHVFARWIDEHVPAQILGLLAANTLPDTTPSHDETRDAIRKAAFDAFPGAQARYEAQLSAWNREQNRIFVKNTLIKQDLAIPASIASVLPVLQEGSSAIELERSWRGALRSALVKIIVDEEDPGLMYNEEENYIATPELRSLRDEHGILELDQVTAWIGANWEWVGRAAWADMCKKNAERLRAKRDKQARMEEESRLELFRVAEEQLRQEKEAEERLRQRDLEKEAEAALRYG